MEHYPMFLDMLFTFFIAFAVLFLMRRVARRVGLVDHPSHRKHHNGAVPLVGGISIAITILNYMYSHPGLILNADLFMLCILTLTFVGAVDDRFDLSVWLRIVVQILVSVSMMYFADVRMNSFGNLLGFGEVELGPLSEFVTVLAVIACINAFNMVDGIDGLLGGLSIVTFSSLGILLFLSGERSLSFICVLLVVCMVPYIILNLGLVGHKRKVFMGDAGSMMIGFTVIWLLLGASQSGGNPIIRPVTALWLIAVPLMDMVTIMVRRINMGKSPFKPDREHLHHICQRLGFSSRQTLLIIFCVSSVLAAIGVIGEVFSIPEYLMFYSFIGVFVAYFAILWSGTRIASSYRQSA